MKITKFALFTCALLLSCQALLGQSKTSVGFILSPTLANFRDAPTFFTKSWMPTLSAGTALRVQSKKAFFFQAELSYERKGFNLKGVQWTDFNAAPFGEKFTIRHQFDYLIFTPTVGFATRGKVHFEGSFGVFCGYLALRKDAYGFKPPFASSANIQPNINDFNRFDVGTTTRAGVGFDLKEKWSLTINAVGNVGFSKVYKPVLGASDDFGRDKTVSLGLQLGLFYKI